MVKKWLIKAGFMLVVFAGYSFIINPARTYLSSEIILPAFQELSLDNGHIKVNNIRPKAFSVNWKSGSENPKKAQFKSPFGLFWGIGMVTLIAVSAPKKYYLMLNILHVITGSFGAFFLFLGAGSSVYFFLVSDFFIEYVEALGSLLLAPLSYIAKQANSMDNFS